MSEGRFEAVPSLAFTRRSGFLITALLLAAALGLRLFVASRMPLIEVDGAYWCSLAGALARGDFAHGVSAIWPPVYPALVALAARALDPAAASLAPDRLEWAGRLVSALAGTLMLWPLGVLASRLLPPAAALATLVIAAVHPRLVEYSAAALSESVFTLIVVVAPTHQLMSPPPTPAPARALPVLPAPPTARLWVSVRLLAIIDVPVPSNQPSLVIAPPMPQPAMKAPLPPSALLPPVLPLPPRASL